MEILDEMLEMDDAALEDLLHPSSQPDWLQSYIRLKFHSVRLEMKGGCEGSSADI